MNPSDSTARRGEIWWVNLDPTIGSEIQKRRPALVISSDRVGRLPVKVIVPITEWDDRFADSVWHVRLEPTRGNGLTKRSAADALQVRCVSLRRFAGRVGVATATEVEEVTLALAAVLQIPVKLN